EPRTTRASRSGSPRTSTALPSERGRVMPSSDTAQPVEEGAACQCADGAAEGFDIVGRGGEGEAVVVIAVAALDPQGEPVTVDCQRVHGSALQPRRQMACQLGDDV